MVGEVCLNYLTQAFKFKLWRLGFTVLIIVNVRTLKGQFIYNVFSCFPFPNAILSVLNLLVKQNFRRYPIQCGPFEHFLCYLYVIKMKTALFLTVRYPCSNIKESQILNTRYTCNLPWVHEPMANGKCKYLVKWILL